MNISNIILSEKQSDDNIFHPILLNFVTNDKQKHLTMPFGNTNKLSDQKYFINKTSKSIFPTNNNEIFFSNEYFFKAMFNASTFDEKIALLSDMLNSDHNEQTIGLILGKVLLTFDDINDQKINSLVEIYSKYYKKYKNIDMEYSELFLKVKNMLK